QSFRETVAEEGDEEEEPRGCGIWARIVSEQASKVMSLYVDGISLHTAIKSHVENVAQIITIFPRYYLAARYISIFGIIRPNDLI
ncbi:hypothetical protein E4T56_gene3842, partial [Termitomyces sp. T112]